MNWLYNNEEITDISQFPPNTFGFVYEVSTPEGKKYIGKVISGVENIYKLSII